METTYHDPAEKLRDKTDKSLEDERGKTDEYLDKKSKKVEDETSQIIRLNRLVADKKRDNKRAEIDHGKIEQRLDLTSEDTSQVEHKDLMLERARSDKAQNVEREEEDRARSKERFQKRLIAEALLENERKETDSNLLDERVCFDVDSEQNSRLLSDEKHSHDLTKAELVTRDQFLAIVSHDLKNPLTSISMSAGLMRRNLSKEMSDKDSLLKNVGLIERSVANMDRMISDLLDVERMANNKLELRLERIDLYALLQECKSLFAPVVLNKSFSLNIDPCSEPMFATIDHDKILQVLSNLIGNALKFTPNGGAITISIRKQNSEVTISVADNGPGIPKNKMELIFQRFSQLKTNDRRGLGLGLFISKWIVEAHKGHISVDSEVGKGSVFSFTLPLSFTH